MTQADYPLFREALTRLGRTLGHAVDEDTLSDYFEDLKEFAWAVVDEALVDVRRTTKFWPRPAVIRAACLKRSDSAGATTVVPPWVDHVRGIFWCQTCSDTGFMRNLQCAGDGTCQIGRCGQEAYNRDPHDYTRFCTCRGNNPILLRQREISRRRNQTNEEART